MSIRITHTAAEGTLALGTSKGDGSAPILKGYSFRWSRTEGFWYRPNSRDRDPRMDIINGTANGLRLAGFDVEVDVDDTPRATADVEADRAARSEDRTNALAAKSARLTAAGSAQATRNRELRDLIPLGQPMMPDHYSYNRDRRFRDRLSRNDQRAWETINAGEEAGHRADAAATNQAYRMTGPVTERRIAALEAELRGVERSLTGYTRNFRNGNGDIVDQEVHQPATGEWRTRLQARAEHLREQITYWQGHLQALADSGTYRKWSPDDFHVGDCIRIRAAGEWLPVKRVNKKSVTVPSIVGGSWTDTVPYDKIRGHRPSETRTPKNT